MVRRPPKRAASPDESAKPVHDGNAALIAAVELRSSSIWMVSEVGSSL